MRENGATALVRKVTVSLVAACLIVSLVAVPAHAGPRPLQPEERSRVEDAVQFLREMGEDDWADNIEEWLREGLILSDPAITSRAKADREGRITIRSDLLQRPTRAQQRNPIIMWWLNMDMARMLIHEKVHAHYQAPDGPHFEENDRSASDWGDSFAAFLSCEGPHALEIEAYYAFIGRLLDWLRQLQEEEVPEGLQGEALELWREEQQHKIALLWEMIDAWVQHLKDADPPEGADRYNYEKGDYLADAFTELDDAELTEHQLKLARIEILGARLAALFEKDGAYERMRAAAERARRETTAEMATPEEEVQLRIGDGLSVTVLSGAVSVPTEVSLSLVDLDRLPPAGFAWIHPQGTDAEVFQIEGENLVSGLELTCELTDLPTGAEPLLYSLTEATPPQWTPVPGHFTAEDGRHTFSGELGNGLYALLQADPSFTDVPPGDPAYLAVEQLRHRGVMLGLGDGTLGAAEPLTRAQFAALLVRALGLQVPGASHPFTDVGPDTWYGRAGVIETVYAHGLLRGVSALHFDPEAPVTREQVYTVLVRATRQEELALAMDDAEVAAPLRLMTGASSWAGPYLAQASRAGLIAKYTPSFGAPMRRDEAARVLHRLVATETVVTAPALAAAPVYDEEDDWIPGPAMEVDPDDPATLSGLYRMTGEVAMLLPNAEVRQLLEVVGGFDLAVTPTDETWSISKTALQGRIQGLVLPAEAVAGLEVAPEQVTTWLELVPDETQAGEYNPATGEFWMVTTVSVELGDLGDLSGPYAARALEVGTLDPTTAVYRSSVALSVLAGPFSGTTVLFFKSGNRGDSLDDIRRLLRKDSLTADEQRRVREYLQESAASEADKIKVLRDLIKLAQDATGETLLITPLEVIDAIIAGIRDIEETLYGAYRDMRDAGMITEPGEFTHGTTRQKQKYEMRYLLEQLRRRLQ